MRSVIYNLSGVRPPITGIGRYAIELLRGGLEQKNLPIYAAYAGALQTGDTLSDLLTKLEQPVARSGQSFRNVVGLIPMTRQFYRSQAYRNFAELAKPEINSGALFHDINFSNNPRTRADLVTVYDVSNKTCADTHPKHRIAFLEDFFANLADSESHIVSISNSVKSELVEFYDIAENRIDVTHLAADTLYYPRSKAQCNQQIGRYGLRYKSYVLCVGTREPRKNLVRVLDAYESLDANLQAEYPLVIAGAPGWKSAEVDKKISRLKQRGLVIDIGFASQQHLPALYSAAAAFVYPSIYEGFGLPLLEAMQSGCPCITSNRGSLAEVSQQHALEVNPLDVDDIASSLNRLLSDSDLNEQYSLAGVERAKDFSWAKTLANTLKIYDAISNH